MRRFAKPTRRIRNAECWQHVAMDSLSQAALGAAISVAVMQRRTAAWKAALLGAVAGTLPDLDVLLNHGDAVLNMVLHRAETHALFWLALFSLPFSWLAARAVREGAQWRRWYGGRYSTLHRHGGLQLQLGARGYGGFSYHVGRCTEPCQ